MANNPIWFKGVMFKAGGATGHRPSFVAQEAVNEQELAERVVLECGLAMSPNELLLGFRSVLERAPQYVAGDGRTRQVSGLMKWYASATGRLECGAGDWNDTCRGSVKVSLLKNAKALLAGPFKNVDATDAAKLDNVTYVGARSVVNVVKVGAAFAAYGRNMQMLEGDTAALVHGGTSHPLACTTSGVTSATFAWPASLAGVEPGTRLTFVMSSRGGNEAAPFRTQKKEVTVLAATGPLLVRVASAIGTLEKEWGRIHMAENVYVEGLNFDYRAGDAATIADAQHTWTFGGGAIVSGSDTALELDYMKAVREDGERGFNPEADGPVTIAYKGAALVAQYKATRG